MKTVVTVTENLRVWHWTGRDWSIGHQYAKQYTAENVVSVVKWLRRGRKHHVMIASR